MWCLYIWCQEEDTGFDMRLPSAALWRTIEKWLLDGLTRFPVDRLLLCLALPKRSCAKQKKRLMASRRRNIWLQEDSMHADLWLRDEGGVLAGMLWITTYNKCYRDFEWDEKEWKMHPMWGKMYWEPWPVGERRVSPGRYQGAKYMMGCLKDFQFLRKPSKAVE